MGCTYFWECVKLCADSIYSACDTDRIVEDCIVSINLIRDLGEIRVQNGYETAAAETHFEGLAGIQITQRAQNTCLWAIGIDRAFWEGTRLIWGKARRIGLFVRSGRADEGDLFGITLEIERWFWVGYTTEGGSTGHLEVRG